MSWMIYGANGYTGRLVVEAAVKRGLHPILAGRNGDDIEALGREFGLETRIFSLDHDTASFISDLTLVLNCAGPFSQTIRPMLDACLSASAHYLDITGEIDVFEYAWRHDEAARQADVVLCPGVGFDVVPTDCLAAQLVRALPAATALELAFEAGGGPSRGTAKTSVEALGSGGRIRRDGELVSVPLAWKTREIPFPQGNREAVSIPWGDVFTAWVSTGVPDIVVYLSMPPAAIRRMRCLRFLGPLLSLGPVQAWLKNRIEERTPGPDEETRENTRVLVWGEVTSADGRSVSGTLTGPNGYDLTVATALGIVDSLLQERRPGGYYTPSLLMGADYINGVDGVTVELSGDTRPAGGMSS